MSLRFAMVTDTHAGMAAESAQRLRWDPTAKGRYREHFGAVPYSFDAGGVHFTGFDPTQPTGPGSSG